MAELHLWVPGAVVRPQRYGRDHLDNVWEGDIEHHWTDIHGLTTGFATSYSIKNGHDICFHFPFTVPTVNKLYEPPHVNLFLDRLLLLWRSNPAVHLTGIAAHSGFGSGNRFPATIPFQQPSQQGDFRGGVTDANTYLVERDENGLRRAVKFGLIISVQFSASDGQERSEFRGFSVSFAGAGVFLSDQSR